MQKEFLDYEQSLAPKELGFMKSGIYKILSPSNRVYIGQSVDLAKRKLQYATGSQAKQQKRLYESIKKYGASAHVFEIIEFCELDKLNSRERYWQEFYDVTSKNGLNCKLTQSEDKSGSLSDSLKDKIRQSMKGTTKTCKNLMKAIYQYDLNGRLIYTHKSTRGVCRTFGYDTSSISNAARGINGKNYAYGSFWSYEKKDVHLSRFGQKKKGVNQFDLDGNVLNEYDSVYSAAKYLGTYKTNIIKCCKGLQKSHKGYVFKYKTYEEAEQAALDKLIELAKEK